VLEDEGLDAIGVLERHRERLVLPNRAGQADAVDPVNGG
jgi:hypothetical protein